MDKRGVMKFKVSDRIKHPIYGPRLIIDIWPSRYRYSNTGTENFAIKFDKGGPMGFASDATNNVKDLTRETV